MMPSGVRSTSILALLCLSGCSLDSTFDAAPKALITTSSSDDGVTDRLFVSLDGSASFDSEGATVSFRWSLVETPDNSSATLDSLTESRTSFMADRPGAYVVQLTVNDGVLDSLPATATIVAPPPAVTIVSPDEDAIVNSSFVELIGMVNYASATVNINGVPAENVDGNFRMTLNLPRGENAITVEATAGSETGVALRNITVEPIAVVNSVESSHEYQIGQDIVVALDADSPQNQTLAADYSVDGGGSWWPLEALEFLDGRASMKVEFHEVPVVAKLRLWDFERSHVLGELSFDLAQYDPAVCSPYLIEEISRNTQMEPRDGAGLVEYNGQLWVNGGFNANSQRIPNKTTNEVWFSSDGSAWSLVRDNSYIDKTTFDPLQDWEGRHFHGSVVFDNSMWILAGDPLQFHYQNDIWRSEDGLNWRLVAPATPWSGRSLITAAVFDDKLWVFGGQTFPQYVVSPEQFHSDVWSSSNGIDWDEEPISGPSWSARSSAGVIVFNDRLWLLGGGRYETRTTPERSYFNDVWSSADGRTWRLETASAPWVGRFFHNAIAYDGYLWVFGGTAVGHQDLNDIWVSTDGRSWTQCPSPITPRHAASMAVFDGNVYVLFGYGYILRNDAWRIRRANQ